MKKINLILFSFVAVCAAQAQSIAPSIINSTGGTAKVDGYIVDWSFCEVTLATTYSVPGLIVTQGVLQNDPFIDHTTAAQAPLVLSQSLKVYPNPSSSLIYIEAATTFAYDLLDMCGKVILTKSGGAPTGEKTESLDLSQLPAGMYILKVTEVKNQQPFIQSYKIQKTNNY